jgi:hypothetical protein
MAEGGISFLLGFIVGGFGISSCWGLFWSALAVIGLTRGTSGWKVVQASLTAGLVPLTLAAAVLWTMNGGRATTWPFLAGVVTLPVLLTGMALRKLPDGTRVGERLLGGTHTMMDTMLGKHSGCGGDCGGCGDEHHH